MRYRNGDRDIRELERALRADPNDLNAYAKLLRAKVRAGLLTSDCVVQAARLGHAAAQEAEPDAIRFEGELSYDDEADLERAVSALSDRREIVSFACDCAERVLPIFEREAPDDARPRLAIEAARKWISGPYKIATSVSRDANAAADAHSDIASLAASSAADVIYAISSKSHREAVAGAAYAARTASSYGAAERLWQRERLAQYLLGEVPLPPAKKTARKRRS